MENVEIPDDFYVVDGFLCHKSCLYVNRIFTNCRYIRIHADFIEISHIDQLKRVCDIHNKIEEITYFVDGKYNHLKIYVYCGGEIIIYDNNNHCYIDLLDKFLQYLRENYPESIKSGDIKIALKD